MASIDFSRAAAFIAAVPEGHWTTYGDTSKAGDARKGAQAIGQWLLRNRETVPHVYRVLTVKGFVADGFRSAGPGVPANETRVRDVLRKEGVTIDAHGRASKHQPSASRTGDSSGASSRR
jgi:alkylated DNA nucleotide flippase Atl1